MMTRSEMTDGATSAQPAAERFARLLPDAAGSGTPPARIDRINDVVEVLAEEFAAPASVDAERLNTYGTALMHDLTPDGGARRSGRLALESVYGPPLGFGPLAETIWPLVRDPWDPGRMRLGASGADLPRFGDVAAEIDADYGPSPPELRAIVALVRSEPGGDQRALIGEPRNDDGGALGALHLALLRLHNLAVASVQEAQGTEARFAAARDLTRWHVQWLALNAYLPAICEAEHLRLVLTAEAPLYATMLAQQRAPAAAAQLPVPLEGWCAARAAHPVSPNRGIRAERLAAVRRCLGEDQALGAPSGQAAVLAVARMSGLIVPALSEAELRAGPLGVAMERAGMIEQTPLWLYLRREAEILEGGARLGPLGTVLLASALVGAVVSDPGAHWHWVGPEGARWHPGLAGLGPGERGVRKLADLGSLGADLSNRAEQDK